MFEYGKVLYDWLIVNLFFYLVRQMKGKMNVMSG